MDELERKNTEQDSDSPAEMEGELVDVLNPLWISLSEAAKIGGVTNKTVRRAVLDQRVKYKITKNRYQIDLASFLEYLFATRKLKNKFNTFGIGQYIREWRTE